MAIVCAMWLTGFDVPSLSTLYLDKLLKAQTLMQAIALVRAFLDDRQVSLDDVMCREVFKKFKVCINAQGVNAHRAELLR